MEDEIILLDTPEGQIEANVVAAYSVEDNDYIALVPTAMLNKGDPDVILYRYKDIDDGIELLDLTDEEFDSARSALEAILAEEEEGEALS